ncbi:MAG: hypothetical protein ACRC78_18555 [Planktothrix sp.]
MNQKKLNVVLEDLDSSNLETQVLAVEQAGDIVQVLAMKVLETFKTSNNPLLIAERLYRFGSILVPYLETLFQETENSELKLLSAIVLLRLGSKVGVSYLLQAIIDDQQYPCLVASCLASIPIYEAINPILQRLRSADLQEIDLIISFLTVLEELNHNIPNDLYQRFTASEAPWQVQAVAKSVCQTLTSRPQMITSESMKIVENDVLLLSQ